MQWSEVNLHESVLPFQHVTTRDLAQVVRLGDRGLRSLSHLIGSIFF